jgi:membrane-bound metal-dependent hydrolase YbcI (DUF457 family)
MALPTGHSFLGICLYFVFIKKDISIFKKWKEIVFFIFSANVPDIDHIPYFVFRTKESYLYHHGITHTLGFAILYGAIVAVLYKKFFREKFIKSFIVFFILVYSHVLLDFFSTDDIPPIGVMLFYPFDSTYIISPLTIFGNFLDKAIYIPLGGEMLSLKQLMCLLLEVGYELSIFITIGFLIWYLYLRRALPISITKIFGQTD